MLYVISVYRTACDNCSERVRSDQARDGRYYCSRCRAANRDSRPGFQRHCRAVATLEEARDEVLDFCEGRVPTYTVNVPEQGSTIGPLPDGTVIEVVPIGILDLAQAAGYHVCSLAGVEGYSDQQIVDTYNYVRSLTNTLA